VARAPVLLRAAEGATDDEIAQALHLGTSTVPRTRQRFVDEGLLPALSERLRPGQCLALTGKQAALADWVQERIKKGYEGDVEKLWETAQRQNAEAAAVKRLELLINAQRCHIAHSAGEQ